MAKRKKSLVDMMDGSAPDSPKIEEAVNQIHTPVPERADIPKIKKKVKEPTRRVSVDTPTSWHKVLRKITFDMDTDLKTFYLQAVQEKCERIGQPLPPLD